MAEAWIVGTFSTAFGRFPDRNVKDLTREAVMGALRDARMSDAQRVEATWFGNCGMWVEGQGGIRGQVCLTPLVREGCFSERTPVINVEAGCATASLALHGAWLAIRAQQYEVTLAIGVEKTFYPGAPERTTALYEGGIDQYDRDEWLDYYRAAGAAAGKPFEPGADRTIFMDTYAMQACWHMNTFGTTREQIAAAAAKNHVHGSLNPRAQYRFPMTAEQVLADRPVTFPLTRAMCAPVGDGAAAAVVVSDGVLQSLPPEVRERAVRISAIGLSGGKYRALDEPGLSQIAATRAYRQAGHGPERIQVAEVHDATSFCEIYQAEMLGFCAVGAGGTFVGSGAASLGGLLPINTSGGLVSKGHPVGATGLSMIAELVEQLRGEAGERQVNNATVALAENGGGVVGFDEAACAVTILERRVR